MKKKKQKTLLEAIDIIEASPELTARFREVYATEFDMVRACITGDLIKNSAVKLIKHLANV